MEFTARMEEENEQNWPLLSDRLSCTAAQLGPVHPGAGDVGEQKFRRWRDQCGPEQLRQMEQPLAAWSKKAILV